MAVVVFDFQAVFAAAFCKTLMDRDFVVVIRSEFNPVRLVVYFRVCAHVDDLYVHVIGVAAFVRRVSPWLLASWTQRANLLASGAFSIE